jgi:hypothetical protein
MQGAPWPHVSRDFCQVTTLLTLLGAAISKKEAGMVEPPQLPPQHLERLFIYCAAWALGGLFDLPAMFRYVIEAVGAALGMYGVYHFVRAALKVEPIRG